jgi:hypothetical protein
MAVDPLKNKKCWIKAPIFAQRASSGAAGIKVLTGKSGLCNDPLVLRMHKTQHLGSQRKGIELAKLVCNTCNNFYNVFEDQRTSISRNTNCLTFLSVVTSFYTACASICMHSTCKLVSDTNTFCGPKHQYFKKREKRERIKKNQHTNTLTVLDKRAQTHP